MKIPTSSIKDLLYRLTVESYIEDYGNGAYPKDSLVEFILQNYFIDE